MESSAVLRSFEVQERETRLSVLDQALAQGLADAEAGPVKPMSDVVARLEGKYDAMSPAGRCNHYFGSPSRPDKLALDAEGIIRCSGNFEHRITHPLPIDELARIEGFGVKVRSTVDLLGHDYELSRAASQHFDTRAMSLDAALQFCMATKSC